MRIKELSGQKTVELKGKTILFKNDDHPDEILEMKVVDISPLGYAFKLSNPLKNLISAGNSYWIETHKIDLIDVL